MSNFILQREINLYSKLPFIPHFVLYKEEQVTKWDHKTKKTVDVKGKKTWQQQGSGGIIWALVVGRHYNKPVTFDIKESFDYDNQH